MRCCLALMALKIGPGDEVILPAYTFFATASAVWRLGATPVFVDIDPKTFNIDPQTIAERANGATKAILPVHLFGQCADMEEICRVAERLNVPGDRRRGSSDWSRYRNRSAGTLGDIACFSFYPTKKSRRIWRRRHADHQFARAGRAATAAARSWNGAALLSPNRRNQQPIGFDPGGRAARKLPHFESLGPIGAEQRRAVNDELFAEYGLDHVLHASGDCRGLHARLESVCGSRARPAGAMPCEPICRARRSARRFYYPVSLHQQECFRSLGYVPGSLPESGTCGSRTLALPISRNCGN